MSSLHYHPPPPLYHGGAPPLPPKPNQKILSLILKAMIMTVITLFFFIFLGVAAILLLLATAAVHRHSTPSSVSSNGFSRKDLKSLPQFKFFRGTTTTTARCHCNETVNNGNECVICLDGIRQGQWCRKLVGCGHMFHKRCVDTWLVKVATCPVCRTRVTLDSGGLAEDRSLWGSGWRNDLRVCS